MYLARTDIDGLNGVIVEVLGPPNAIGVCRIRHQGQIFSRFHGRLTPHNDETRELLAKGVGFVERPAVTSHNAEQPEAPKIDGWTLAHVAQLREMLIDETTEYAWYLGRTPSPGKARTKLKKALATTTAALRYVNAWLKTEHIRNTATRAGLTEEDRHDPNALLSLAAATISRQRKALYEATGTAQPQDDAILAEAIRNYLAHHASTNRERMPVGRSLQIKD